MNLRPWRAKIAALVVLFFLGTFAGQIHHLLDSLRGKVDRGAKITNEIRETVTTIDRAVGETAAVLQAQIADLQAKLAGGTATPDQIESLRGLLARLKAIPGPSGSPGPPGPSGSAGPPGPPAAAAGPSTTTTTAPGGTTTTTRPAPTTTSTRPSPSNTTTTTHCAVGIGGILRLGCM